MFSTIKELVALATEQKKPISEIMIEQEMEMTQQSREYIWEKMEKNLQTMKNAVERSVEGEGVFSPTGLTGGDALKMKKYRERGKTLSGDSILAGVPIRAWNKRSQCCNGACVCDSNSRGEWNLTWRCVLDCRYDELEP